MYGVSVVLYFANMTKKQHSKHTVAWARKGEKRRPPSWGYVKHTAAQAAQNSTHARVPEKKKNPACPVSARTCVPTCTCGG